MELWRRFRSACNFEAVPNLNALQSAQSCYSPVVIVALAGSLNGSGFNLASPLYDDEFEISPRETPLLALVLRPCHLEWRNIESAPWSRLSVNAGPIS